MDSQPNITYSEDSTFCFYCRREIEFTDSDGTSQTCPDCAAYLEENPFPGLVDKQAKVLAQLAQITPNPITVSGDPVNWVTVGVRVEHFKSTELSLFKQNLTQFPTDVLHLSTLRELSLANNNITTVPDELCKLRNLRVLNLNQNKLTGFPEKFPPSLRQLFISFNELVSVPKEVGKTNWFYASRNHLVELPSFQGSRLTQLTLSYNQLVELPRDLVRQQALRYLDLKYNKLESFPFFLVRLPQLHYLDLSGNTELGPFARKVGGLANTVKNKKDVRNFLRNSIDKSREPLIRSPQKPFLDD